MKKTMKLRISFEMKECPSAIYNIIYIIVKNDFKSNNTTFGNCFGPALLAEFEAEANPNETKEEFATRFLHTIWKTVGSMILFPMHIEVLSEKFEPDAEDFNKFIEQE